jgi:hypothetical protein
MEHGKHAIVDLKYKPTKHKLHTPRRTKLGRTERNITAARRMLKQLLHPDMKQNKTFIYVLILMIEHFNELNGFLN